MISSIQSLVRSSLQGIIIIFLSATALAQTDTAFVVYPEFENVLANSQSNSISQNSLALFSGSVGAYSPAGSVEAPVIPASAEGVQLVESGFGQTLARAVPYANFESATITLAQAKLYPPDSAETRELIAGSGAAFRYKQLLYSGADSSDIRAGFEGIATYFDDPERQLAREGIEILRQALKYSPLDKKLRNALLDAYYDYLVAEAQHVKNDLSLVAKYRLGLVAISPGEFIIDKEIDGYVGVVEKYGSILDEYSRLFVDRGGIDVSQIDNSAPPGIILGQWIFQQEQPQRNQMAAQFRDAAGNLTTVPVIGSTNSMLFAGYKDYAALLGVMRDYAQSAAELAKLYGMRGRVAVQAGQKDDKTLGFELIEGINREILLNNSLLNALLPNAIPPESGLDASGVRAAMAGVLTATAALTKVGSFLNSQVNMLGFDPDFLVLFDAAPGGNVNTFDSYDRLFDYLGRAIDPVSIIGQAKSTFDLAKANYDNYRGHADQVFNELDANEDTYAERYRQITGYFPEDPPDPYPSPVPAGRYPPVNINIPPTHVNNPRENSELRQVYLSIEQSDAKQATLGANQTVLDTQIKQASDRLDSANSRSNNIATATKNYKDVISTQRDTVTHWNAAQAGAQAAYETWSDLTQIDVESQLVTGGSVGVSVAIAGAANIAIQTAGEEFKGNAEKELDLAAADFDKDLALADSDQNIFQAGEEQRNLQREHQSLILTMLDNGFVHNQGLEQVDGLTRELQQAAVFREQNNSDLAGRYYADPIHYLRAQNSMLQADYAFRSAQRWVFFALRALEYKYNQPFIYSEGTPGSPRWELGSLFRIRNYMEMEQLLNAMNQFNGFNSNKLLGRSSNTEQISLKDDVWGRTLNPEDRLVKFRKKLEEAFDGEFYVIKLNTLSLSTELETGLLFRGAQYRTNAPYTRETAGFYLDKIEWIKVKFVDTSAPRGPNSEVLKIADLAYGGTCFVRPECPEPVDPGLESENELRRFPFRSFKIGTDTNGVVQVFSSAEQSASTSYAFWNEPNKAVEPTKSGATSTFLKERSVATSELRLTIAGSKVNLNTLQDVHIYINHFYALRGQACQ